MQIFYTGFSCLFSYTTQCSYLLFTIYYYTFILNSLTVYIHLYISFGLYVTVCRKIWDIKSTSSQSWWRWNLTLFFCSLWHKPDWQWWNSICLFVCWFCLLFSAASPLTGRVQQNEHVVGKEKTKEGGDSSISVRLWGQVRIWHPTADREEQHRIYPTEVVKKLQLIKFPLRKHKTLQILR